MKIQAWLLIGIMLPICISMMGCCGGMAVGSDRKTAAKDVVYEPESNEKLAEQRTEFIKRYYRCKVGREGKPDYHLQVDNDEFNIWDSGENGNSRYFVLDMNNGTFYLPSIEFWLNDPKCEILPIVDELTPGDKNDWLFNVALARDIWGKENVQYGSGVLYCDWYFPDGVNLYFDCNQFGFDRSRDDWEERQDRYLYYSTDYAFRQNGENTKQE